MQSRSVSWRRADTLRPVALASPLPRRWRVRLGLGKLENWKTSKNWENSGGGGQTIGKRGSPCKRKLQEVWIVGLGRMEKFRCPMGRPREQPGRVNPRSKADFVECDGGVEYVHCLGEGGNQIHKKNSRNDRAREPKTAWLLESHSQSRISSSISNSSSNSSSPPQQGGCDRSITTFPIGNLVFWF